MPGDADGLALLWKQYSLHVDLYKFYLDLVLKAKAFFYAITGGILTFYFAHSQERLVRLSLVLPGVMGAALGSLFWHGATLMRVVRDDIAVLIDQLGLETGPEVKVLAAFLLGVRVDSVLDRDRDGRFDLRADRRS